MLTSKQKTAHHRHNHSHHSHRKVREANYDLQREKEMVRNRIALILMTLCASYALGASSGIFIGLFAHLFGSLAIIISYKVQPNPSNMRRFAGLVTDFGAGYYLFSTFGESVAVLYPIYLWVILGYGFRFGNRWLLISAIMGAGSFGASIVNVPFWQDHKSLTIGLLAGLIVVPAYCSTLITKLSQAKEEAEKANKAKTLFLASISHELRTPLNAIIGYGTHLLDMGMPEKQNQMVATSVSAGRHLLHLINQLLSFAKSESTEELPEPQEFRPTDILVEVRDIMAIAAEEKGLALNLQAELRSDQPVFGQTDYVKNILINLTSNAIKFTDNGSVLLKCGIREVDEERTLWCSVTDTGPGIAKEAQEKIFGVFQQADDTVSKNFGGSGLGLAICQKLAAQLGGSVSVESELGNGSTFTFTCPISPDVDSQDHSLDGHSNIVSFGTSDQSIAITANEGEQFSIHHINVREYGSAVEALKDVNLTTYDVALISSDLAGEVGDEDEFWQSFRTQELPPVLVSEDGTKNLDEIFLRAAFASILPTSPDFDDLRSAVQIGCSFTSANQSTETAQKNNFRSFEPRKILVADDNRTNLMVMETILTNAEHEVTLAVDGEDALEKLENSEFDIVFLDVNMPKLGGIDCCKMWRQIEGPRRHIPMIALTADSTEETERKCLDAGMDLRLTKPVEAGTLLSAIQDLTVDDTIGSSGDAAADPLGVVQNLETQDVPTEEAPVDSKQLQYLKSIGDDDFIQSIVDAYLEDTDEIFRAFRQSVKSADVAEFRFHAHAFKSGANNIGATKLSEICGRLEVISEHDFEEARFVYLEKVEHEINKIKKYLTNDIASGFSDQSAADENHRQAGT